MSWIGDTASLYGRVFRRGVELTARNWSVALAVIIYTVVLRVALLLAANLGLLGGFLWTVALAACMSSWLTLVEQVVRMGRADLRDLPASFGAYLGDLLTVGFLLFGLRLVASLVLAPFPLLQIVFALATVAFLNAVPELIYLGRHTAAELLVASYRFIAENWVEWFPPTVLLFAVVVAVGVLLPQGPFGLVGAAGVGVVASYAWVVRGLLFLELTTSGRRAREFRRRAAG